MNSLLSKIKFTILALILASGSFPTLARVVIESPAHGSFQQGILDIHGWSSGSQQLRVLVDDLFVTNLRADTLRADVNPDIETGFSLAFNYSLLTDGEHELVVADALTGESDTIRFTSLRLSDTFLRDGDVVPREFNNVIIAVKGQTKIIGFKWDVPTQSFRMVRVEDSDENLLSKFQQESLDEVNRLRTEGVFCHEQWLPPVAPVAWLPGLADAARRHTKYLNEIDHLQHKGRGGSNPGQRMLDAGVNWLNWGENAHQINASAEIVIDGYVQDVGISPPGHCLNIMDDKWTHMGTAIEGRFSVQDFTRQN